MGVDQKIIDEALKQIDFALEEVSRAGSSLRDDYPDLDMQPRAEFVTLVVATIERFAPPGSVHRRNAEMAIRHFPEGNRYFLSEAIGTLRALRADYEKGYLAEIHELIHGDLFSDFLEQAEYLLEETWKDPAAVIAGGVLEEHLRKLCQKNGIETVAPDKKGKMQPKKASRMNDELKGKGAYEKLGHSQVDSWLKLRNLAAHGKYHEYDDKQVGIMISGIRDFIVRRPA
ncbi:MAG TPA: hypothetical protein VM163_08200 [bacterium]|nr:hypothetical protein [bacterium]